MSIPRKRFIHECVRSTTHRFDLPRLSFFSSISSPRVRIWGVHFNSFRSDRTSSKSYPLSRHILRSVSGFFPSGASVSRSILKSFRFAPATGQESGMPFRSVAKLRFVPPLALSVGFFPVFFPTERSLRHRSVGTAETPINTFYFVVSFERVFPYFLEHPPLRPFLESPMRRA